MGWLLHTSTQKLQFPSEFQGNLCHILGILCFARFLKNKFFGGFIAIINKSSPKCFLLKSEKSFFTFVCEFTMFFVSSLQSFYVDPLPALHTFCKIHSRKGETFSGIATKHTPCLLTYVGTSKTSMKSWGEGEGIFLCHRCAWR